MRHEKSEMYEVLAVVSEVIVFRVLHTAMYKMTQAMVGVGVCVGIKVGVRFGVKFWVNVCLGLGLYYDVR